MELLEVSKACNKYEILLNCILNKTKYENLPIILKPEIGSSIYDNMSVFLLNESENQWGLNQKTYENKVYEITEKEEAMAKAEAKGKA